METVAQVGPRCAGQARILPKTVSQDSSGNGNTTTVGPSRRTDETLAGLRLLVAYRQDLVADEARVIARVRESLGRLFPSLERRLDWTSPSSLVLVARYQTPDQVRHAGPRKVKAYLRRRQVWNADHLSALVTEAASAQTDRVHAEEVAAQIVANLASDALQLRERIDRISRLQRGANGWPKPPPMRYRRPGIGSGHSSTGSETRSRASSAGGHDAGRRLGDAC